MNISNPTELALLQLYGCRECAVEGRSLVSDFSEARPGFFHKFPPIIGGTGKLKLIFVGYNPRRTKTFSIHDFAMSSFQNFCTLSNNIDHHGQRYIDSPSKGFMHYP